METIETLRKRIHSAEDLQSVVKTMKAMAATSIWQYEQAVAALADYGRSVERGLQIILTDRARQIDIAQPQSETRLGAVIFGSDQGLVGQFNDQIVTHALDEINAMHVPRDRRQIIAVGRRVQTGLDAAHQPVMHRFTMPTSLAGIEPRLRDLIVHVQEWWQEDTVNRIVLFHNQPESGASYSPTSVPLLPLDLEWLHALQREPWPGPTLPDYDLPWDTLFSALIQEFFFVATHRAFAESLAAENASRLASMQAAERNIDERLDHLWQQYHQQRQSSITAELLDIVAGAEATGS